MLFRVIRKIKVSSDWFGCILVISLEDATVFSVLNNDRFNYVVARVKCESDWNAIDIFLVDRFFGHGGGPLERQKN